MARLGRSFPQQAVLTRRPFPSGPVAGDDDARISQLNPWWFQEDWAAADPHLRRLRSQPVTFPAPLVDSFDLVDPGVHTIRGPRQVGKSTDLKLLAERAMTNGYAARQVIYLALDALEGQSPAALSAFIARAREFAPGQSLLLLDAVSAVSGWQIAIKDLWDRGVIDRDVIVCTGSSAIDLARGAAERLPGRRGRGRDHLVLPQAFNVFAGAVDSSIPPSPGLTLEALLTEPGQRAIKEAEVFGPRLASAFDRYLRFGGLPAAVVEAASGGVEPSEETKRVLWDSLIREVLRKGASEPAARALLERVLRSLGSKTNWSRMAREMGVPLGRSSRSAPDHKTVQDYIEFLAMGYFLLIVYFWKRDADSSSLARDKKLYFGDPLLHEITHRLCCPGQMVDIPALVENVVALTLYRRYESRERQIGGFLNPEDLHVWETSSGKEVDFVCGPRRAIDAVEVKYQNRMDRRELSGLRRAFPNRPVVVATRGELELTAQYALVPVHLLLWALGDT
jgi:predicted AAA+ superfamily ATPase